MRNSGDNDCFGNIRALERREFYRRWGRRLAAATVLAAMAFGAYQGYGVWRKHRLAQQAGDFFARADYQSAALVARQLLRLDPSNLTAARIMAETAEAAGRREALSWREQVAARRPLVAADQIALAKAALKFGQLALARRALDQVDEAGRASVKYHQLVGALAIAEKKTAEAEEAFAKALGFEPKNQQLVLNLASIQLASNNPATREKARIELARLAEQTEFKVEALRALAADALAHDDRKAAEKWATRLRSEKRATFSDVLLYLEAAQKSDDAQSVLHDAQQTAAHSSVTAAALITWMNRHGMAPAAVEWGLSLPKEVLKTHPMPLAVAESYSFLQDWGALHAWVDGKNWGAEEYLRLAVESHVLHHLTAADRSSMESDTAWSGALKATMSRTDQLATIAHLAEGWGYADQAAEAWWLIANGNDNAKEALSALQRLYKATSNSHGLLRVAKRTLELNPADLVAANNCASLGLLLNGDNGARRLATKLHSENPSNAAFNATYAFGLFTEGKTTDALRTMETLKEAQLRYPAIAAYYFVMLVENGKMERAHLFLSDANKAQLLPEEAQLLTTATRKLLQYDSQNVIKSVAAADSAMP